MDNLESLQAELDTHKQNGDEMYLTAQWYHGKWHAGVVINRTRGNCTWVGPSFDACGDDMYFVARCAVDDAIAGFGEACRYPPGTILVEWI